MKKAAFHILAGVLALAGATTQADDSHPHRTITISGECRSCELARENLYGAEILGASFIEANFDDTQFNHAVIVESRFIGSSLSSGSAISSSSPATASIRAQRRQRSF